MKKYKTIVIAAAVALVLGVVIGLLIRGGSRPSTQSDKIKPEQAQKTKQSEKTLWTCSMHPQIKQPKPGKCPICGMTLIPLKKDSSSSESAREVKLSPNAVKLAEIATFPVERKFISYTVRMTGKIEMNEQSMAYITARMPGRIDRLFIDYTGIAVKKGDHMAEYYSPELLLAQRELLVSVKELNKKQDPAYKRYGMTPEETLAAVRKKLLYWGLTEENIKQIIKNGKVVQHITLYAPVTGIVTEKNAVEGKYFKTGDRLFTIADLSKVWVMLEAYESDIAKLKYGQKVSFTTEAYPGKVFHGRISFIEPTMDLKTRVIKVRVDADNNNGLLKPGMFVRAEVQAKITPGGRLLMDKSLIGKWICPMHPGVIKDKPGKCHICGMNLVKAETLGYAIPSSEAEKAPLVIPVTAPLITGKRAVVYVQKTPGVFEGREVVLGPRGDGFYIVKKGLKAGEKVVTHGNFKIDSALQIMAKPSMMSMTADDSKSEKSADPAVPEKFVKSLDMIYSNYFKVTHALAEDNLKDAKSAVKSLKMMLEHIQGGTLNKPLETKWNQLKENFATIADAAMKSENINKFRANFASLTSAVDEMRTIFGASEKKKIYKYFCPMAFDNKGAFWLDTRKEIFNPYFGKTMQKCGEEVK